MSDKKVCKIWKAGLEKKKLEEYIELVKEPKYICKKCGRVANSDKNLCKSQKIK